MLNKLISSITLLLVLAFTVIAGSKDGKVTGVISGAHCAINGMACPPNHDLTREELPGVFTKEGKFYFLANVPQSFLAQWPAKNITVEGKIYENEHGIDAQKISIKENGKWSTVFENGDIIDDMGHKVSLADAVIVKGKWYCPKCSMMMEKKK